MRTVNDIVDIAKISEYLCANDIQKKGLWGGGVDLLLPNKIYSVRKNVEWLNNHNPAVRRSGFAMLYIDDVWLDNVTIVVSVKDPILGTIVLGDYTKQSYDTTVGTLGGHIATALMANPYNYYVEYNSAKALIYITAPPQLGASINGNNLLVTSDGDIYVSIIQFNNGVTYFEMTDSLNKSANYLYALCAPYNLLANSILNNFDRGGTTRPISYLTLVTPIRITNADFDDATHWNGRNSINQAILSSYKLQVFANFIARYLQQGTEWVRTGNGINILIDGFDATVNEYEFYIDISL